MTKIWRLEDADGVGVYQADGTSEALAAINGFCASSRHPTPSDDVGLQGFWGDLPYEIRSEHYFGFASLAQYRAWFFTRKSRRLLAAAGIRLCLYEVPATKTRRGMNQAIFIKSEATLIEERFPDFI